MFRNYLHPCTSASPQVFQATHIAKIYKFPPPPTTPLTISVISFGGGLFGNMSPSGVLSGGDAQAYWTSLGITSQPKIVVIPIQGATNSPVQGQTATDENTIDVSMIGACCPTANLTILLFLAPNSLDQFQALLQSAISPRTIDSVVYTPSVVSISWGAPEIYYTQDQITAIQDTLAQATRNGINFCAAAGDDGSNDGVGGTSTNVDFPASSPYVTACGGTSLICPALNYADAMTVETAWPKGGGGVSKLFTKPSWQIPIQGATEANRCLPDIALVADPSTGVEFIINGSKVMYGGTSIVAPAFAAYYACLNVQTFLLPNLYAASVQAPKSFHDITVGSNGAYNATTGYDLCTGFGSIAGDILTMQLTPQGPVPVTGIMLDLSSATIVRTKQLAIYAMITPTNASNKHVNWTIDDPSIASIVPIACPTVVNASCGCPLGCECGCRTGSMCRCEKKPSCCGMEPSSIACDSARLITGLSVGTTKIHAITSDGNFHAVASITIVNTTPVTGVSLNKTYITIEVGSQTQLTAIIAPTTATNPGVTWSSSTPTVASVSSTGLVTAKAVGTASVVVKTVEGGFTARALITVTPSLLRIAFVPSSVTICSYTAYQSNLVVSPTPTKPIAITYTSDSPSIATVNSKGVIIGYTQGTTTIHAKANTVRASLQVNVVDCWLYYATKSTVPPIKPRKYGDYGATKSMISYRR